MRITKSIDKIKFNRRSLQKHWMGTAAHESDKDILLQHIEGVTFKKTYKMMRMKMIDPLLDRPAGQKEEGKSKTRCQLASLLKAEEQVHTVKDVEEPAHQEFETSLTEDHPVDETSQPPDWFQKPAKPPTPYLDWNKTLPTDHGTNSTSGQSHFAQKEDPWSHLMN
ncbi:hypothetical protein Tco_0757416 [Tanacetum coccineum]